MLRVAKRRSLIPADRTNDASGESENLDNLFEKPDLTFGSFSVLFDPISNDLESNSLVRVAFKGEKTDSSSLYLYGLIKRKQIEELSRVNGEVNRMKTLNREYHVKLVGRKSLCSTAESLITSIRSSRTSIS